MIMAALLDSPLSVAFESYHSIYFSKHLTPFAVPSSPFPLQYIYARINVVCSLSTKSRWLPLYTN